MGKHGSGKIKSVEAKILEDATGEVVVKTDDGNEIRLKCQRKGPCEWEPYEKHINGEYVDTKGLKVSNDMIGALEEAWQTRKKK